MIKENKSLLSELCHEYGSEHCDVLKDCVFICLQHCLLTTVPLFESLIKLGVNPKHIFLLGKNYSNSEQANRLFRKLGIHYFEPLPLSKIGYFQQNLLRTIALLQSSALKYAKKNNIKHIIIMDDGARLIEYITTLDYSRFNIFGIEQTSKGIEALKFHSALPFPIINVARSSAKKNLESMVVAKKIIDTAESFIQSYSNKVFGIVGFGCIGKQIASILDKYKAKYIFYDKNELVDKENINRSNTVLDVFSQADVIFGCTGNDITMNIDFSNIFNNDKLLLSCSSEDIEFRTLLRFCGRQSFFSNVNPLNDIIYQFHNSTVTIKCGGFPINFDETGVSVPYIDIQLTRSLMLSAIIQIANYIKFSLSVPKQFIALDTKLQKYIIQLWLVAKNQNEATAQEQVKADFIQSQSEGVICEMETASETISSP